MGRDGFSSARVASAPAATARPVRPEGVANRRARFCACRAAAKAAAQRRRPRPRRSAFPSRAGRYPRPPRRGDDQLDGLRREFRIGYEHLFGCMPTLRRPFRGTARSPPAQACRVDQHGHVMSRMRPPLSRTLSTSLLTMYSVEDDSEKLPPCAPFSSSSW